MADSPLLVFHCLPQGQKCRDADPDPAPFEADQVADSAPAHLVAPTVVVGYAGYCVMVATGLPAEEPDPDLVCDQAAALIAGLDNSRQNALQ